MDINNSAYKLLKQFYRGRCIDISLPSYNDDIDFLIDKKCLKEIPCNHSATHVALDTEVVITPYGKAVVETKRRMLLKHWIPYFITTAISLLSLYNAILARLN